MSRGRTRRVNVDPHEPIPWRVLQDKRISFRARGILGYLLSLPDGWEASAERIAHETTEGRDAVATALKELEQVGYLARRKYQAATGKWAWIWLYSDTPDDLAKSVDEEMGKVGVATLDAAASGETVDGIPGDGLTGDDSASSQVAPSTGYPSTVHPSTDFQGTKKEPSTGELSTQETKNPSRSPRSAATYIPDDFKPTPEMVAWARAECPDVDGRYENAQFFDYWKDREDKGGMKRDWTRTWQRWMRKAQKDLEDRGKAGPRSGGLFDVSAAPRSRRQPQPQMNQTDANILRLLGATGTEDAAVVQFPQLPRGNS